MGLAAAGRLPALVALLLFAGGAIAGFATVGLLGRRQASSRVIAPAAVGDREAAAAGQQAVGVKAPSVQLLAPVQALRVCWGLRNTHNGFIVQWVPLDTYHRHGNTFPSSACTATYRPPLATNTAVDGVCTYAPLGASDAAAAGAEVSPHWCRLPLAPGDGTVYVVRVTAAPPPTAAPPLWGLSVLSWGHSKPAAAAEGTGGGKAAAEQAHFTVTGGPGGWGPEVRVPGCPKGFAEDDVHECRDINECEQPSHWTPAFSICGPRAYCANTAGSFLCIPCPNGSSSCLPPDLNEASLQAAATRAALDAAAAAGLVPGMSAAAVEAPSGGDGDSSSESSGVAAPAAGPWARWLAGWALPEGAVSAAAAGVGSDAAVAIS